MLCVGDSDGVTLGVSEFEGVEDAVRELEGVGVALAVFEGVSEGDLVAVEDCVGVTDGVTVVVGVVEDVREFVGDALLVTAVGLCVTVCALAACQKAIAAKKMGNSFIPQISEQGNPKVLYLLSSFVRA
jgi:hypothetical protein